MNYTLVHTNLAPEPIGTYSQGVGTTSMVFISGQIALDPKTGNLVSGVFEEQARRVFDNVKAVATAAGGSLARIARVTVYLTDVSDFATLNKVMAEYFQRPYPARATVAVAALPRGALLEVEASMEVSR